MQDKVIRDCMVSISTLNSHLKVLSNNDLKGIRTERGFKWAFAKLFDQDVQTFTGIIFLNVDQLEKQFNKEEFQENGSTAAFSYFLAYTQTEVQQFHDTLIQHMESVKKSIDERALHKREYDIRVNERQMQTKEGKVDTRKSLDVSLVVTKSRQQHTEKPEFNNKGEVDQNAEQCHDKCHLLAKLTDNKIMELSNQSFESKNIWQHGQFLKATSNEAKVKKDIDDFETINIELEHSTLVAFESISSKGSTNVSKGSKVEGDCGIAKSWITCVNTNRNTTLRNAGCPCVRVFLDPILFLAGLQSSWEHGQERPVILVGVKGINPPNFFLRLSFWLIYDLPFLLAEMAFRNFIYAEDEWYRIFRKGHKFKPKRTKPSTRMEEVSKSKSCGNGAHYGYNCPPKVPTISNPEPCHNQNVDEFLQTLPSFHPTCYSGDRSSFTYDSTPNFVDDSPNVFNPPSQPPTYSCEFCGNDAHYGYDCPPQPSQCRKIPICYDEDDNEESSIPLRDIIIFGLPLCIAITPVLSTVEPVDSLIMEDEHLDTIPAMKSDEVIKSSVENLVQNPSEFEDECDDDESSHEEVIHEISFKTYSTPLFDLDEEIISSEFNPIHNEDLDSTLKNDRFDTESYLLESLLNHDTLMASSPKIDSLLNEFAGELITIPPRIDNREHKEYISLLERLLYDNSSPRPSGNFHANPNTIIESLPTFPIPVEDSDSLREEIDIFPSLDDSIPPGIESDDYDSEDDDNSTSLLEFESFHVNYPNLGDSAIDVVEDIPVDMPNILPTHPTLYMDFNSIPSHNDLGSDLDVSSPFRDRNKIYDPGICIEVESTRFLATHSPVIDTLLPFSSENKNKVFNHGVLASKEKSLPSSSHQGFKASKLFHHKSPMLIHGEDIPISDVPFLHFYPP
ncbi:hypothetical protein Tco_0400955 [Tanacetum coccineum]